MLYSTGMTDYDNSIPVKGRTLLKVITSTGSIEASADEERRVRGLSDAALCRELNQAAISAATGLLARPGSFGDPFVWAELHDRPHIRFGAAGWHSTAGGSRAEH
jgi:hypothetical protein